MSFTLTCGCKVESQGWGIFCEWDTETRECEPAIAYGCLCAKHYVEYKARPTEAEDEGKVCARCGAIAYDPVITQTAKTLTDKEIWKLWQQHLDDEIPVFARAILKKASEK